MEITFENVTLCRSQCRTCWYHCRLGDSDKLIVESCKGRQRSLAGIDFLLDFYNHHESHTRIYRRLEEDEVPNAFEAVAFVEVSSLCVEHEVLLVVVELVPSFGHAVLFAE